MVDKKACLPLHFSPSLRPGGAPATDGYHQTAGSQVDTKLEGRYDFYAANMKDIWNVKEWRKVSTVWGLFVLVVVGGFGVYMCMVGLDRRQFSYEPVEDLVLKDVRREDDSCPRRDSLDFYQHYPLPHTYERNECTCTPVHYFVILSMQRSGSGWFETLLNNHPNISSHGEIFSVRERRDNFSSIARNMDKVFNLDWLNSASKNECTAAVGFKWMLNQGPMEYNREVLDYFERMGVSVILLLRRNVLKRLISIMANSYDQRAKILNGTHKSHVHSVEEALKLAEYRPVIDVNHLPENLQRVEQMASDAQRLFNKTRSRLVYYEDLVMDSQRLTEIQAFLGVPSRKLESQQVKIHTRPLREQIQNWDEVLGRLNGTRYELLMRDDDYT